MQNVRTKIRQKEKMKTVSFQIRPSDYEELQIIFETLGLTTGAGLRYALTEFKRKYAVTNTEAFKNFSVN